MRKHKKKSGLLAVVAVAGAMLAALSPGLAWATTVPTGYATATSTGAIGPAAPGGVITVTQILEMAQDWIDNAVPYSQTAGWEDNAVGGPYREDCSGFVSMAWGLQNSLVTSSLPSVANFIDAHTTQQTDLRPADALDYTADHVALFTSSTDQAQPDFFYNME